MSAEQVPAEGASIIRLSDRRPVAEPDADTIRLSYEQLGAVEKLADAAPRPTAGERAADAGRLMWIGLTYTAQTAHHYAQAGEVTERIEIAKRQLAVAKDDDERDKINDRIAALRAERKMIRRERHRDGGTIAGAIGAVAYPASIVIGTLAVGPLVLTGVLPIPLALWVAGRKARKQRELIAAARAEHVELTADGVEPGAEAGQGVVPAIPGVYSPEHLPKGKPFPIARVTTEAEAAECILRALIKEGIPVGDVTEVERTAWGWQCVVRVTEGTPAAIIQKSDDLETLFDTGQGSVRVQPMIEWRARAKFRIVLSDPFVSAPSPEYLAPKSISITDRRRIGSNIDADELVVTVAGVMGEVIAASGGGKTGILQALAEITTACCDAITIDLDPAGDGLEDLGPAARLQGRTHEQIEHVLLWLLMLAKTRARLRKRLGMGRKWVASPEHPSIVVFIDEYPALSKLAKKLAFDLLKVGRKEAIPVIIASQGGTTTYLGENIAQMLAMKIVGPCKKVDTNAVFGDGAAAEGWLPHRLAPATDTDPKDAGHVFAQGIPGTTNAPVEHKIHEHPMGALARLAEERRDAGLLDPDADSLKAMADVDLPDYVLPDYDAEGNLKKEAPVELLTWEQLLKLCEADPPAAGVTPVTEEQRAVRAALDVMAQLDLDRFRVETMAEHLRTRYPGLFPDLTADDLGRLLRDAGCGGTVSIGAVDGRKNASGYRREALEAVL